jgi:ATP-dependent Clp protease ATP-binding subunit ClpB
MCRKIPIHPIFVVSATVDFKNAVIIMTSNIGSQFLLEAKSEKDVRDQVMAALKAHFRPEFLNRVDETLIFHRLSEKDIAKIVDIQLVGVQKRLAERKLTLHLTDAAKAALAKVGYDPDYGARPLKRAIQKEIVDPLAKKLLAGDFEEGDAIELDALATGHLFFKKAAAPGKKGK